MTSSEPVVLGLGEGAYLRLQRLCDGHVSVEVENLGGWASVTLDPAEQRQVTDFLRERPGLRLVRPIEELIEHSSLGAPEVKAARASVSDEDVAAVMRRYRDLGGEQ